MHNIHHIASMKDKIDVIIHLTDEPVALQKQKTKLMGDHFPTVETVEIEATIALQQQQVIKEMDAKKIYYERIHTYKTVLNAITTIIKSEDIDRLLSINGVLFIEPNLEVKAMGLAPAQHKAPFEVEIDPIYSEIKALWAEGIEGQGVKVAVLDSGIDKNHPDLKDVYKGGINFIDQSNPEEYKRPRDDYDPSETSPDARPEEAPEKYKETGGPFETYHGTHIAGIIAGNNKNGVKGVAPKIDLYAYRVLGAYTGGEMSTIIKGIEEAVVQKMDIINLSLSEDSDLENHALSIAVNNAVLSGVTVISTAGNTGSVRGSVRTPGTSRLGISVGNSNLADEIDASSSRGPSRPNFDIKPDIVAPGTEILSTMPRYCEENSVAIYQDAYKSETGTSQSAPYITGIAALIKQKHPDFSPSDVKVAITNTATVLNTALYNVFDQGAGRVQPYAAVHPTILAYATEDIDANGKGKIVQNTKGSVTFGAVTLSESVSITKSIIVKDIQGDGGIFDVKIQVTQAFSNAAITVDQPSFTLNGECLLCVTLTASKNEHPKYRDEMLGYIHIINRDQSVEVSLPFAADFSDGEVVTPAIEEFSITKNDLSFTTSKKEAEVDITLSLNSDLSYPSLEITDYVSKAPIDSLFYNNGISLGTRKFPLLHKYTSSWTNEDTTLEDGIYAINFTGMAKETQLTSHIGPVFIKSTNPVITGSISKSCILGQVKDQYIDFNHALSEQGEGVNLNEKLHATYCVTRDGKRSKQIPFLLKQDGTFLVHLDAYLPEKDLVTVSITDAAGNKAEVALTKSRS